MSKETFGVFSNLVSLWWYFITTFVIPVTAKFVITYLVRTKSADPVFCHCYSHVILKENIRFVYLLDSPRRGDSNKYTKRIIHKKLLKSIRYSCVRRVHSRFLYHSIFDLTEKSLVTNTVVITRVLCKNIRK